MARSCPRDIGSVRYLGPVRTTDWVVYAKPPFAGPQQVLDYVGRYTHRVVIANHRLLAIALSHVAQQPRGSFTAGHLLLDGPGVRA